MNRSQKIKVRVRNRMTGDKADSGTCPGNAETMLWQCLMHKSVSPDGQGPCSDSMGASYFDGKGTLLRDNFASTSFRALLS